MPTAAEDRWCNLVHRIVATSRLIASAAAASPHLAPEDTGITQALMMGQTIRRRPALAAIPGISRKNKKELVAIAEELGITGYEDKTVEQLRNMIYNHAPPVDDLEDNPSGPRRPRDPNMPGLGKLSKTQLTELCRRYSLPVEAKETVESLKSKLYQAPPKHAQPAYQCRTKAWTRGQEPKGSSSSKASQSPEVKESPEVPEEQKVPTEVDDSEWQQMEAEEESDRYLVEEEARGQASVMTPMERAAMLRVLLEPQ